MRKGTQEVLFKIGCCKAKAKCEGLAVGLNAIDQKLRRKDELRTAYIEELTFESPSCE